jgi:hypothetical protein
MSAVARASLLYLEGERKCRKKAGLLAHGSLHLVAPSHLNRQWLYATILPNYSGGTASDLHRTSLFTFFRVGYPKKRPFSLFTFVPLLRLQGFKQLWLNSPHLDLTINSCQAWIASDSDSFRYSKTDCTIIRFLIRYSINLILIKIIILFRSILLSHHTTIHPLDATSLTLHYLCGFLNNQDIINST